MDIIGLSRLAFPVNESKTGVLLVLAIKTNSHVKVRDGQKTISR
jgi:hypothetical protein